MKKNLIFLLGLFFCTKLYSQVVIKSHSSPTITSKGIFGKTEKISETIIPGFTDTEITKLIKRGNNKFAEPKFVDVSFLAKASKEVIENDIIYRHKVVGLNATSLVITFGRLLLSKKAELYIYNFEGTVILGPITASENIGSDRTWSSNSFQGNSVILELRIPKNEQYQNDLHISKILLGLPFKINSNPSDSLNFGSFNTSSSCNVNVLCSQGNPWSNERKAICLIETDNGGHGTGALVMNTCNTNKPYILTAWHIVTGVNPTNWTFIFGWWSSTCTPNTNNQEALLFNGAIFRASYQQSDFALIELSQTPPPTSNLTYLGWSRSSSIPASSVGIHHPKGDQMKISFADSPATIGQIYVWPNNAWRVLWNLGTSEPGSSGSPLFNVDHRVIGQSNSGSQPAGPPCNQLTGGNNYGRFDLSWIGGGTNATRLSNWLDPSNSGAVITNTTNIANLITLGLLSISGSDDFCNGSQQYTLNGVPAGTNISWQSSNPNIATISPTGNPVTLTKVSNGYVTITATGYGCESILGPITKTISIGSPVTISSTRNGCNGVYQIWTLSAIPPNHGTNWNWYVSYLGNNSQITIYSPSSPSTQVSVKGGGTVSLTYTDACGVAQTADVTVYSTCYSYSFRVSASPNPAKNNINVNLIPEDDNKAPDANYTAPLQSIESKDQTIISLFEMTTGNLVKQWKYNKSNTNSYDLNISGLRKGVYVLQVDRENQTRVTKIIIE